MHLYTYANHLWWAINGQKFVKRQTLTDTFTGGVGFCEREPKPFREECIDTAQIIRATTQKDIIVLFSGGVDGEVVVRSFLEAGIPFTPIIYRYKDDANVHEYEIGVRACEELGIDYELIDLDAIGIWEKDYAEDDFYTPVMSIIKYALETYSDCYVINGFMPPYFKKENTDWIFYIRELSCFPMWYSIERSIHACGAFFLYKPENLLSILEDPLIDDILTEKVSLEKYHHPLNALRNEFLAKFAFFEQHFPGMEWRPKYIGYEQEKGKYRERGEKMLNHGPLARCIRDTTVSLKVNDLKSHLRSRL